MNNRLTREQICQKLRQAELFYLMARGWICLVGIKEPYLLKPGTPRQLLNGEPVGERYYHNEAVRLQKEIDQKFSDAKSFIDSRMKNSPEIFFPKRCKDLAAEHAKYSKNAEDYEFQAYMAGLWYAAALGDFNQ